MHRNWTCLETVCVYSYITKYYLCFIQTQWNIVTEKQKVMTLKMLK